MRDLLYNQFGNLFLWVPFLMAAGAGVYFTFPTEPVIPYIVPIAIVLFGALFIDRIPIALRGVIATLFGFCWAIAFTGFISTPQMPRDMRNLNIVGNVDSIDYTDDRARVFLRVAASDINAGDGDTTVRVSIKSGDPVPNVGDTIRADIGLYRVSPPDAPETFDYARWLYFNGISATGYISEFETLSSAPRGGINVLRDYIHRRTDSFLGDSLVLGYKNAVPADDGPIWTATGVGHVWSISGFHMTLVSGWLFAIFYTIFRGIPYVVRRVPARKPAMICAWAGLAFYLFLSGLDVATIRAFLMTSLIFLAFILGRSALSLRNVCVAFCIIFLINPHYIMQAGFQLSFAAMFGLIWLWGDVNPRMPHNKILAVIYGTVLTSLTATLFTAPFVALHFGAIPIYSIFGNLILLPVFSFVIMPLIIVGTVCACCFGWGVFIDWAHGVYDWLLPVARWISELPFSNLGIPHVSNLAICFMLVGLLCMVFVRPIRVKINYILFALFMTTGVIIVATAPRPIFMTTQDNELVGFVDGDKIVFNKSRASNHYFAFDTWKQLSGFATNTPNSRQKHDHGLYMFESENFTLAYMQKFVPLQKNLLRLCADDDVDYIVSYFRIDAPHCAHKILHGGFVIYESGHVKHTPSNRRWHNPRIR